MMCHLPPKLRARQYRSSRERCQDRRPANERKQSTPTRGLPSPVSLMKRIPALDTVAGVAFFNELISKTMRIASLSGTRSLETSVKTCSHQNSVEHTQSLCLSFLLSDLPVDMFTDHARQYHTALYLRQNQGGVSYLVIVHNRVHRLDPDGINVSVQDHPLVRLVLVETLHKKVDTYRYTQLNDCNHTLAIARSHVYQLFYSGTRRKACECRSTVYSGRPYGPDTAAARVPTAAGNIPSERVIRSKCVQTIVRWGQT